MWVSFHHARLSARLSALPIPHLREEMLHVDFLALHLHHPRVFDHAPGRCATGGFFFETVCLYDSRQLVHTTNDHSYHKGIDFEKKTYQHSMKYLKFSLHLISASGSFFNFGIGCLTIYVKRSISPAFGCISVPSAGKGKRCCATSSSVTPRDHTSEVMV